MSNNYHLANISTNTNDIAKMYSYHLASILTNTNNITKVDFYHLTSILININDKANKFTRHNVGCVQLIAQSKSLSNI